MKKIILLGFYLFIPFMCLATSSLPSAQTFCEHPWENFPVLAGGRVKPLWVHAKESLQLITGNKKIINSMNLFCHLSLKGQGIGNPPALFTSIEHKNLQEFLSLGTAKEIEIEKLLERKSEIQLEYNSLAKNDGYKKELSRLFSRMNLYEEIIHGISWTLPTPQNAWTSLSDLAMDPHFFTKPFSFFKNMQKDFIQSHGKRYQLESFYFKFHLFSWSMLFIFCALFTLVLLKNKKVGLGFVLLAIILQLTAMILRILISQRAPVTNMYETVMFSGLGSLIVSVFIYRYKKELLFVIAGLSYNVLCLFMMTFAHGMLSPQISPLVPVLRDNFWLSTHVTTVVLSYGALALSWILANILLIKRTYFSITSTDHHKTSELIYTCVKVGTVLLTAGIILGGIWADYSWGRFWGWDPKETWSLIVLVTYMMILHGRKTSWIPEKRFVPLVAAAFMMVMMAWFGVNYILATGLHSYGFSEGGAIFLGSFFLLQCFVLILSLRKRAD